MKKIFTNKVIRFAKIISMLTATIVAISAYQIDTLNVEYYANGSNSFDIRISFFCMLLTKLVTIEYWKDWLLRIIAGTTALMCMSNYIDELLFDPFTFDLNEKVFAVIILINFIHTLYTKWINRANNTIQ